VAVVSPSDACAVGWTGTGTGSDFNALIEHWNGTAWNVVPVPASVGTGVQLNAVTGISASNVWAVGTGIAGPALHRVILHWNGCMWTVVPSPNPPSNYLNLLWGIAAISRDNAWAVGTTDYSNTLIVHWNGTSWS
jgi:hypothetical protein